eukprot:gb/GECG01016785.1/.p1 GENE.gb/GECG01016785.1/~~gb/GECG01016785.1/.p1  ORF type:complete len:211 (+),score=36.15 gb/GECG01016785.1/:1-633(+)
MSASRRKHAQVDTYFRKRSRQQQQEEDDAKAKEDVEQNEKRRTKEHRENLTQASDVEVVDEQEREHERGPATLGKNKQRHRTTPAEAEQPALFAEVGYKVKGEADDLTEAEAKVVEHVERTHEIPKDFNLNKEDYGCISGTSYERRLIRAFELQLIQLKRNHSYEKMCRICAAKGHFSDDCPKVFDDKYFSQKAAIAFPRDSRKVTRANE